MVSISSKFEGRVAATWLQGSKSLKNQAKRFNPRFVCDVLNLPGWFFMILRWVLHPISLYDGFCLGCQQCEACAEQHTFKAKNMDELL